MRRLARLFTSVFKAAAEPVRPVISEPAKPAAIHQEAPRLAQSTEINMRFQIKDMGRQAATMGMELQAARDDLRNVRKQLEDATETLVNMRIMCYCQHAHVVCIEPQCRELGCKERATNANTEASWPGRSSEAVQSHGQGLGFAGRQHRETGDR